MTPIYVHMKSDTKSGCIVRRNALSDVCVTACVCCKGQSKQ